MSSLNISWKEERQIKVGEVIENGFIKKKKKTNKKNKPNKKNKQ